MRVFIHDYAGHPFQIQLSRSLASRGYPVRHVYCASLNGPRGALEKNDTDPDDFDIKAIELPWKIDKYSLIKRRNQEIVYGKRLVEEFDRFRPDVVISANAPLDAQAMLLRRSRRTKARFIFWLQDLIGTGAYRVLRGKGLGIGSVIGRYLMSMEARLLRESDQVVLITGDHLRVIDRARVDRSRVQVIENWAPLDEFPVCPRDNPWAREHGLIDKISFIYTGTLGMKHNPDLLLQLAIRFRDRGDVRVVVVSEGKGATWLKQEITAREVTNLKVLPFQPIERMPQVIGSADVLAAILENDAGVFSVPSKVLTYHCAQRPLLIAIPGSNLGSRIVTENRTGLAVEPNDLEGFITAADRLVNDAPLRDKLGQNARLYAQKQFDIESITDRFEGLLQPKATANRPSMSCT